MKMQTSVIRIAVIVGVLFSLVAVTDFAEAQTGSLSGVVRSGTTLVNGAQVRLSPGTRTETSNFLGVFSFSDLPVGEYTIRVTASGYQTWNGSKTIIGGINIQDVELTPLVETGSLTGVVRSGATLVGGALVSLSPGNLKEMTNMVGTFNFADLLAGDYAITVTADGYEPWSGSKTIASGINLQDVELTAIVETGSLTGAVRSGATLISGALVALSPGGYETTTSIAGTFNFTNLPVGEYAITVTADGYEPWSGSKTIASGINLQDVELTAIVETGSLTGAVRSGATLISGALVALSPGGYETTTSIAGTFNFTNLPVGEYAITVTADGYEPWSGSKTIASGINLQDVELTAIVETGSLTGAVRSGATLISGALVALSPGGYEATTSIAGTFNFTDLPVGDYAITVTAAGYEPWSGSKTVVSGINLQDVELTAVSNEGETPETGSLSGVVRSGLTPVSGAAVSLSPGGYETTTSIAGTFNFTDLPVGDYVLTVTAAGYEPWSGGKTVVSGINVQDVELTAIVETGSLTGAVRSGATLISGALVALSPGGYEATTSFAGTFNFTDLPVGDYAITVTAAGYEPWSGSKTIVSGINLQDVELTAIVEEGEPEGEMEGEPEGELEGEPEGEEDLLHPADLNGDWRIVLSEAIAYLSGWQQGSNPLGYAIRAAYLWQNGELYAYDPSASAPMCWVLAE
ncbi:MAG: C protein alpha-antigen precursor [Candidatus Hydrogenedentes bacterium ADurb.Bin179]|nr:MAG: C protein alpha-antigen precursor [Candidatus Hydrogenedentes bacterium ADurb.Bin179]